MCIHREYTFTNDTATSNWKYSQTLCHCKNKWRRSERFIFYPRATSSSPYLLKVRWEHVQGHCKPNLYSRKNQMKDQLKRMCMCLTFLFYRVFQIREVSVSVRSDHRPLLSFHQSLGTVCEWCFEVQACGSGWRFPAKTCWRNQQWRWESFEGYLVYVIKRTPTFFFSFFHAGVECSDFPCV